MQRTPPRFATWLVRIFGPSRHNRALVGDLLEEFRSGRSRGWYWRQAIVIVARTMGRELAPGFLWLSLVCGAFFVAVASIDYVFWRLNRPPHMNDWVAVTVQSLWVVLMFTPAWRRRWSNWDWPRTREAALWIAWFCYNTWTLTPEPLGSRLRRDAIVVVIGWACLTMLMLYGTARPRYWYDAEKPGQ